VTTTMTTRDLGPAPEPVLARDIARRAVVFAPAAVLVCGAIWGADGAASAAFATVVVLANFLLAAWMLGAAAKISYALVIRAPLDFGVITISAIGMPAPV